MPSVSLLRTVPQTPRENASATALLEAEEAGGALGAVERAGTPLSLALSHVLAEPNQPLHIELAHPS